MTHTPQRRTHRAFVRAFVHTCQATLAATACLALANPATAQARYPAKQVTMVVPSAAGGGLDVAMRHTAKFLQENLGQPVIVENRPSVNLLIGTRYVAAAAPDGYTILAMSNTFLGAPVFSSDPVGYDPFKDFIHVSATANAPNLLLVTTASGVTSVRDLIQRIRNAGAKKMTYGTAGTGSSPHVAAASFIKAANLEMIDVPYKGTAPALVDLIGGRLDMLFDSVTASVQHVKAGTLRALGATTAKRSSLLPDVPTMAEALNQPDFDLPLFYGIAVPARTPDDAVRALHGVLVKAAADRGVREQFAAIGFDTAASDSPADYTRFLRQQDEKLRRLK